LNPPLNSYFLSGITISFSQVLLPARITHATVNACQIFHWNCKKALSSLSDIQFLFNSYQIICIQESLLLRSYNFNVSGFHCLRSDVSRPGIRNLCTFIRKDFRFSLLDLSNFSYPSIEILAVLLHCSLDSPLLIINLYRHSNSKTPFFFYLFAAITNASYKYSLLVADFNAHNHGWGDPKIDSQGNTVLRACDAYNLIILNDGAHVSIVQYRYLKLDY